MNESLFPVTSGNPKPEEPIDSSDVSISGWLATILGIYLIGSGVFTIAKVFDSGSSTAQQSTEMLRQSGIGPSAAPIAIVVSYVVGAPIFFGSGLLALGSIARSVKRNKS